MDNDNKNNNTIKTEEEVKKAPPKKKKGKKKPPEKMSWASVSGDFAAATKAQQVAARHEEEREKREAARLKGMEAEKTQEAPEASQVKADDDIQKASEETGSSTAKKEVSSSAAPDNDQIKKDKEAEKLLKAQQAKEAKEARKAEKAARVKAAKEAREAKKAQKAERIKKAKETKEAEKARKAEEAKAAKETKEAEKARKAEEAKAAKETAEVKVSPIPVQPEPEADTTVDKARISKRALKAIIAAAVIVCLGTAGWLNRYLFIPRTVNVLFETMEGNWKVSEDVNARNVSEALEKIGVQLSAYDTVTPDGSTELQEGMTINVVKRLESSATVAGNTTKFILSPGTIEENLEFNNIVYDDNDIVSPKLTKAIKCSTSVEVKDVEKVTKKKKVTVEAEGSKIILDPTLASGVQAETAAVDGVALYTYTYTYINGEKTSVKKKFKKWITEPQDHMIRLGTASTGQSGEVSIARTFVSNTTAYYAGKNARGAVGSRCYYGTCAVDPKVFPYGSRFWVSGYGFCVANDCGGAIKGTKLDLYMTSTKQCFRWGRRHVTAYLLG